ncbi:MAG: undecaprenyl-phosphate glucose phosphotransferase [bacterium]|nr:undecaprenyl-phosphate glucose phosphotransferase [bacterium]
MLRERNQTFKLMFIGLDIVLVAISYFAAVILHFYIISPEQRQFVVPSVTFGANTYADFAAQVIKFDEVSFWMTYLYLGIFVCIAQVIVFIATDLYHPRRGTNLLKELIGISRGVGLNILIVVALLFFYRGTSFSRLVIVYNAVITVVVISVGHYLFRIFLGRLRSRGYNTRNVLILGTGTVAARFYQILKRHAIFGFRVVGLLGPKTKSDPEIRPLIKGGQRDFKKIARKLNPDLIVYAMPMDLKLLDDVIEFADQEGMDCRIVPDVTELITARARLEDMDGMPLLTIREVPLKNGYNAFIKRLFDIVVAGTVIILAAPFYLLMPLLIRLDSRGPVFFSQDRVGLDRKTFRVWKFRTMVVQEEGRSDTTWGSKTDARVTRLGKFLRKSSLDEMPQIWNVLVGDMSIVGPRPERPHFVEQFKERYADVHYMRRHSVKSGITGWAQIQGYRGDTSIAKRAEADIYYIENWSFWLDLMIVIKTLPALIKNPGE